MTFKTSFDGAGALHRPPHSIQKKMAELLSGRFLLASLLSASLLLPGAVWAAEDTEKKEDKKETTLVASNEVHRLAQVEVRDINEEAGETILKGTTLRMNPNLTGTVTDALRGESFVQFDGQSRSGMMGGEILAPRVSIRGARHYENNFLINGISNNNNLNPFGFSADNNDHTNQPTSDSMGMSIDVNLLDELKIYTENVPAGYGGFTGGVLDAKVRDARTDDWHGSFYYRHTNDGWAKQHWADGVEPDDPAYLSKNYGKIQPEFTKHEVGMSLEGPLTDHLGMMLAYDQKYSSIPTRLAFADFDYPKVTQHRRNQNFLLKLNTYDTGDFRGHLMAVYAPYEAQRFTSNMLNSEYAINGGGLNLSAHGEYDFNFGTLKTDLAYAEIEVSRDASSTDYYLWKIDPTTMSYSSKGINYIEGGFGDYEQKSKTLTFKADMDFVSVGPSFFINTFNTGFEVNQNKINMRRDAYTSFYTPKQLTDFGIINNKKEGIWAGQYLSKKQAYQACGNEYTYTTAALWLQDEIEIGRLTVRPGVRGSFDDLTGNFDIAPRFFANLDLLDDNRINIFGGYNRYYGSQILSYSLYKMGEKYTYTRSSHVSWSDSTVTKEYDSESTYNTSNLDTPYSDELNAGIELNFWDTTFKVVGVKRDYKNQLRARSVNKKQTLFSNGESDYWGLTFSLSKTVDLGNFGKHRMDLSATRSMSSCSAIDGADGSNFGLDGNNPAYVRLNGEVIARSDLPASNYNSPWVLAYTHDASFFEDRLRLTGILRYEQGGYRIYTDNTKYDEHPEYGTLSNYKTGFQSDGVNVDLKVEYDVFVKNGHTLTLELQCNNLLDRKNLSNYSIKVTDLGNYSMGRQFWAGIRYTF